MHSDWMKKDFKPSKGSWERLSQKVERQAAQDQLQDKIWKNLAFSMVFLFFGFKSFQILDSAKEIPQRVDVRVQGYIAEEKKVGNPKVRYFVAQAPHKDH